MENLSGVGGASAVNGVGLDAPQPSTAEREEFFSGPAVWPAETAQSTKTELSSARAESSTSTSSLAFEQEGGGIGESPLLAPAPDGRITIREDVKRVPSPWMPPARLVIELMFAARQMSEIEVSKQRNGVTWCRECGAIAEPGELFEHYIDCRVGRVTRLLEAIEASQAAQASTVAEKALVGTAEENFFEPWSMDIEHPGSVTDSRGIEVYDCAGATEVHEDELDRYARRMRACVNFCAGVPTQKLEDAALLESLQGEVARRKGGAR